MADEPTAESNKVAIDNLAVSLTRIEALLTQSPNRPVVAQPTEPMEDSDEPPSKKSKLVFDEILSETWSTKPSDAALKLLGNQKRYSVMWSFRNLVSDLEEACVDPASIDLSVVQSLLLTLKTDMADHMRLIRIADRSKGGWLTVDNYQNDVLARGREDERRLSQAERTAVRTISDKKPKRPFVSTSSSVARPLFGGPHVPFLGGAGQRAAGPSTYGNSRRSFTGPSVDRPCHSCGAPDHWSGATCPNFSSGGRYYGSKKQ